MAANATHAQPNKIELSLVPSGSLLKPLSFASRPTIPGTSSIPMLTPPAAETPAYEISDALTGLKIGAAR